jgi:hypothetical protein
MPTKAPPKAVRIPPKPVRDEEHEETVHQTRYREDCELDEYDEHKLQKLADDPTAGGDGPDA